MEIIADRCATEFSQQVFDVLMRELLAGRPLLKNGEILNLSVEEWASSIGWGAAQRARELIRAGVTMEELELWRASRGGRQISSCGNWELISSHSNSSAIEII